MNTSKVILSFSILIQTLINYSNAQIQYLEKEWQNDYGINLTEEKSDFEIDNNGNLIFLSMVHVKPQNIDAVMDLSGITTGTYILQAKSNAGILTSKFIKQ
jgi:hypothetical protein